MYEGMWIDGHKDGPGCHFAAAMVPDVLKTKAERAARLLEAQKDNGGLSAGGGS